MSIKRAFIFAAGIYYSDVPELAEKDFIIAADGGYKYCEEHEIIPDFVIGDFDSLGETPSGEKTITLPVEKDVTDTAAAVKYAEENGVNEFHIFGGTGGRLDHTLANIALAANIAESGGKCYIYGDGVIITAITNRKVTMKPKNRGAVVSIFSFTDVSEGVTLTGLKYPLNEVVLASNFPLGISNETTLNGFSVEVKCGTLVIIYDNTIDEIA
jgi:thiamine pyrophosphokinase